VAQRFAFFATIPDFLFHRQSALKVVKRFGKLSKALVAITDQTDRDRFAFAVTFFPEELQGLFEFW